MKYRRLILLLVAFCIFLSYLNTKEKSENIIDSPYAYVSILYSEIVTESTHVNLSETEATTTEPLIITTKIASTSHQIDLDYIYQEPELPTGCEITSLTMLLNYLGFDVSKTEMASKYLEKDYNGTVGFDKAFIGDPTWEDGYGCFAPVIVKAAQKYLFENGEEYSAWDVSGKTLEELYDYIDRDMPVVVWCSMSLIEVYKRFCYYDKEGNEVYWYDNEHCVLMCGYDKEEGTVTVADPLSGLMKYSAERFEYIYDELGRQAVIIE